MDGHLILTSEPELKDDPRKILIPFIDADLIHVTLTVGFLPPVQAAILEPVV
jgi:hypothetical protein